MSDQKKKYSHYYKSCPYEYLDIYRVLRLFEVADPCVQHAVKKLLCSGKRGPKDAEKDIHEARDSLNRYLEMNAEENEVLTINGNPLDLVGMVLATEAD